MKLLEKTEVFMVTAHYRRSTIKNYLAWIDRYIRFHRRGTMWVHPSELNEKDFERFLNFLAVNERLAASTRIKPSRRFAFSTKRFFCALWLGSMRFERGGRRRCRLCFRQTRSREP